MPVDLEADAPLIEHKAGGNEHGDELMQGADIKATEDESDSDSGDLREIYGDDWEHEQEVGVKKTLEEEVEQMRDDEEKESNEVEVENNNVGEDIEAQKKDGTERAEAKTWRDVGEKSAVNEISVGEKIGIKKNDGNGEKIGVDEKGVGEQGELKEKKRTVEKNGLEKKKGTGEKAEVDEKMADTNANSQGHDETRTGQSQDTPGESNALPSQANLGEEIAIARLTARFQAAWQSCYIVLQQCHFAAAAAARKKLNEYENHPVVSYSRENFGAILLFLIGVFAGVIFSSLLLGFSRQHPTTATVSPPCLPPPHPLSANDLAHMDLYPTHLPTCSSASSSAAALSTACKDSLSPASIFDLQKRFNRTQIVAASDFVKREIREGFGDVVQARVLEVLAQRKQKPKLGAEANDEEPDWECVDVLVGALAATGG